MYEERTNNSGYTIKNVILITLSVLLFIFLLMWIFPMKKDLNNALKPFYNQLFSQNMNAMKDAAKSYYTLERLPKNVGDSTQMTLNDMLDSKIILPFLDSNGNRCDGTKSYVKVTKMDDEYVMKINLSCTDNEDYILVHMGCYDYCKTTICESEVTGNPTRPTVKPEKPKDPTDPKDPVDPPKPQEICLYIYKTGDKVVWTDWSDWTKEVHKPSETKKVETKVETTYKEEKVLLGYNVKTYNDLSKPIYKDETIVIGQREEKYCKRTETILVDTGKTKQEWVLTAKNKQFSSIKQDTTTTRYILVTTGDNACGTNCSSDMFYIYDVYELKTYPIKDEVEQCAEYGIRMVDITTTHKKLVGYEQYKVKEEVWGTKQVPVHTTLYRYKTSSIIKGDYNEKWSFRNDSKLINSGYNLEYCIQK